MKGIKITIEATINADTNKAWDCYTNPKNITKWNFASDDWHCPKAENNLRVGGIYSARMEAKNGSSGFEFKAVYDEVSPFEKIVYTMEDGRKVITVFENVNNKTKVTTIFEAENQNPIDMQKEGWLAILNSFKRYVENN